MENEFVKIRHHGDRNNLGITRGECEISEKLDGANFSLLVKNGDVVYRSHHTILGGGLQFGKQWGKATIYLEEVHKVTPFSEGYILCMECMTKHQIDYGEVPPVVGFAVYSLKHDIYVRNWKEHFESRGIPVVDCVTVKNPTHEEIMEHIDRKSGIGSTGATQEGIVVKNYYLQLFSKIVRDEFQETKKSKVKRVRPDTDDPNDSTPDIFIKYCTPARIKKMCFKLRDEGTILEMKLMPTLLTRVFDDIIEEEFWAIAHESKTVNFGKLRGLIGSMCSKTLKELLIKGAQ